MAEQAEAQLVEDVQAVRSDKQAALHSALARAQAAFPPIDRNRSQEKPYRFSWASWDHVLELLRAPLADNGLAFTQPFDVDEGMLILRTLLVHADGGVLESRIPLNTSGLTDQQKGSHITYMKRYAGCALLGVAAEEDDDGTAAGNAAAEEPQAKPAANRSTLTKPQFDKIGKTIRQLDENTVPFPEELKTSESWVDALKTLLTTRYQVESRKELTRDQANDLLGWLEAMDVPF
jgi:hypothetical protein